MLKWALIFAVISLVTGLLGFSGVATGAAGVAQFLFVVFVALFLIVIGMVLLGYKSMQE